MAEPPDEGLTRTDVVAVVDVDVFSPRDQVILFIAHIHRRHGDPLVYPFLVVLARVT